MTINDLFNSLAQPRDSGCGSKQNYAHCDPGKKDQPECRKQGPASHC